MPLGYRERALAGSPVSVNPVRSPPQSVGLVTALPAELACLCVFSRLGVNLSREDSRVATRPRNVFKKRNPMHTTVNNTFVMLYYSTIMSHDSITIVIPSVGRQTLPRTLRSLLDQDDPDWYCIVGFDGVSEIDSTPNIIIDDRIKYVYSPRREPLIKNAGPVRNQIIPLVVTKWMAFLDDDDTLRTTYVSTFKETISQNLDLSAMTVRMSYDLDDKATTPYVQDVLRGKIGISFAVNTEFIRDNDITFLSCSAEDHFFLKEVKDKGGKIIFLDKILYNVRY